MRPAPRTKKGRETRQRILAAAEQMFSTNGYSDASVARITDAAGVGQGTFYLYFDSKLELFEQLVEDLNRRVRRAMSEASAAAPNRIEAERAGFRAFFQFTAEHPSLYRIVREAELVSPGALRLHYGRIVDGYIEGLRQAGAAGEIGDIDPTVAAWALMGIGEMIGMRWVLWSNGEAGDDSDPLASGTSAVPDEVFEQMMTFIGRALGRPEPAATPSPPTPLSEGQPQ
ncbi:MAG: TetR/AcrR family transcriptional regulator [Propionibacteriaceae bacterium]|nr:TetR/AcrR family transcriptional regulator [Propionibacteriaceae bacterium]